MRHTGLILFAAAAVACGPPGQVRALPFDGSTEVLRQHAAGDRAYWVSGSSVVAWNPGEAEAEREVIADELGAPSPLSLLVDEVSAFTVDRETQVLTRIAHSGERTDLGAVCAPQALYDDGQALLCLGADWNVSGARLLRVSKDSGVVLQAVPVPFVVFEAASSPTHLFHSGRDAIISVDKATSEATELASTNQLLGMVRVENRLWWLDASGSTSDSMRLRSAELPTGEVSTHATVARGGGLVARGGVLYFSTGGNTIHRFDPASSAQSIVAVLPLLHSWTITDQHAVIAEQAQLVAYLR